MRNETLIGKRPAGLIWVLLLAALLILPLPRLHAASFSALNIDFLGRGGGTYGMVARTGDIDNAVWNASGLGYAERETGFGAYMDYLVQVKGGVAGFSGISSRNVGYGVYLTYLGSGSLTRTGWDDPVGGRGETFSHGELVFGVSAGARLKPYLAAGAGLKLARESTDDVTGGGLFGDLSGTARIYPLERGEVAGGYRAYSALALRNLELARWEAEGGDAPENAEIGLAVEAPGSAWIAGFSYYLARNDRREVRLGFTARPSGEFELRVGYRRRVGSMSDGAHGMPWQRGLSAGFGIGFGNIWIDYTYEDASPLDNIHRFALRAAINPHD